MGRGVGKTTGKYIKKKTPRVTTGKAKSGKLKPASAKLTKTTYRGKKRKSRYSTTRTKVRM